MFKNALVVFTAGLATSAASQQSLSNASPAGLPEGSLNGAAAVRSLGDRFDAIALENGFTPAELATRLRGDLSTYITPSGLIFNVCPQAPEEDKGDEDSSTPRLARMDIPLDDFLDLESSPGAAKTIYLDFDGYHSVGNSWGHNINFPAWSTDGDTNNFSDQEKSDIIEHWREVVEDFAPFDVNVTTKDPGTAALIKSNSGDQNFGIRCVMTQPTNGFGDSFGGIAFLNSFNDSIDNPCFAVNKGLNSGPMTVSHEVGHTLGLVHDGLNGDEYHPGVRGQSAPSWGPIMGAPFGRELVQWSRGDYAGATTSQNDINTITRSSNDVDMIPDDHPDSLFTGTSINLGQELSGIINSAGDIDSFSITVPAGEFTIAVNNFDRAPNLDAKYDVYKASPFSLVATTDVLGETDAVETHTLDAGTYTVVVDGTFELISNGSVSDYGSLGSYTISISEVVPPEPVAVTYPNGLPTQLDENTPTDILVNIDPGTHTLDTNEMYLLYAVDFPVPFTRVDLVPQGGENYLATIPGAACESDVVFNFNVLTVGNTGDVVDPSDPNTPYAAVVVCSNDCVADVNGDGSLTPTDFTAWINAFNNNQPECDQNGDGSCTPTDFTAWIANFNAGC
ncbi:MAG: hypothetical protein Phyf2KO_25090 [Phycisphaerales bacterium]